MRVSCTIVDRGLIDAVICCMAGLIDQKNVWERATNCWHSKEEDKGTPAECLELCACHLWTASEEPPFRLPWGSRCSQHNKIGRSPVRKPCILRVDVARSVFPQLSIPFTLNNVLQSLVNLFQGQRGESEPRTPRLDSGDDLTDVIADDAESHILCVFLDHCKKKRSAANESHGPQGIAYDGEFVHLAEELTALHSSCYPPRRGW